MNSARAGALAARGDLRSPLAVDDFARAGALAARASRSGTGAHRLGRLRCAFTSGWMNSARAGALAARGDLRSPLAVDDFARAGALAARASRSGTGAHRLGRLRCAFTSGWMNSARAGALAARASRSGTGAHRLGRLRCAFTSGWMNSARAGALAARASPKGSRLPLNRAGRGCRRRRRRPGGRRRRAPLDPAR